MYNFAFDSFKSERDRALLDSLRESIFVLKLEAQEQLIQNSFQASDAHEKRKQLVKALSELETVVTFLQSGNLNAELDLSYIGFANRFIQVNPSDVSDRLDVINRLRKKIAENGEISARDFHLLDRLQSLLEEEVAQSIQSLFRL